KGHTIVPSAPIVVKNDPTLMFTNAGMNQFKDIFLGNKIPESKRVADTQKCLRVSGKHNDLEEVGIDTYHHTMFEMLGNWSFGDYFKKEAIEWAWKLLTEVYKIPEERLYVTIFEGDKKENLPKDEEAFDCWKKFVKEDRILEFGKKDNFWEMGDTGPCGPCSEIHFDSRDDEARKKVDGKTLVNAGTPDVIEIWNLVFIQFNRQSDGSLNPLPAKHVDTGMGFERLTRVLQNKNSNYDTDIFQPLIQFIEKRSGIKYGDSTLSPSGRAGEGLKSDIAMRVMSDHIRAIGFAIADGQIPSNTGAGYVIRRILRRAVRYYYSFLNLQSPVLHEMISILSEEFGDVFPEIKQQKDFVARVIEEEETNFIKTISSGMKILTEYIVKQDARFTGKVMRGETESGYQTYEKIFPGQVAFELYDTFGFPIDLTRLILKDYKWNLDEIGFSDELEKQKQRSRKATEVISSDWTELKKIDKIEFVGYDSLETKASVVKYRKQKTKDKEIFQIVLDRTPFYAESGGQVGDKGVLKFNGEEIEVLDTKKENELIIHFVNKFPSSLNGEVIASVNRDLRIDTMNNHSATHLLHAALRKVLGTHVQQKGSLVAPDYLRFDFSHFAKVNREELERIESVVNEKIREDVHREQEVMPIDEAMKTGAMALFGEKYGDRVRVITFDKNYSRELCGGTHVAATGVIGYFKIISESAIAAGVRRIEAVTGRAAEKLIRQTFERIENLQTLVGTDLEKSITQLQEENSKLRKQAEQFEAQRVTQLKNELKLRVEKLNGINFIGALVELDSADALKKLAYDLRNEVDNLVFAGGAAINGKAQLCVMISENLVNEKSLDAGKIIKTVSKEINGGGGGQKFFATAGGTNPEGITKAIDGVKKLITSGN
ncbi:MAG: alanine--tRNA ligase, partial [Chitinophagales bacterium]